MNFAHSNIIQYCNRPFSSIIEHDQALIENWNSVVKPNDIVYHLGDVGLTNPKILRFKILFNLNGKIHLIKGNHDKTAIHPECSRRFESIQDVFFLKTQHKGKKIEIFLSHYAHLTWPKSHYGSISLFGHSHGKLKGVKNSLDVGVDSWQYKPISLDCVVNTIKAHEFEYTTEIGGLPECDE